MAINLYAGANSNFFEVVLQLASDDSYPSSATVTAKIYNLAGTQIGSDITLSYVSSSSGKYTGSVSGSSLTAGTRYKVTIDAVDGGNTGYWESIVTAQKRTLSDPC